LHYLCHYLNVNGYQAYIWYKKNTVCSAEESSFRARLVALRKRVRRAFRRERIASPGLITPVASLADLQDAIVIYPEIVSGNPLKARNIVRFFLHKPGYHTGKVDYGEGELYFYFLKGFDDPSIGGTPHKALFFTVILDDTFKQTNFGQRDGTCYIFRKGKNRPIHHDIRNGVIVDDLPHEEMARVFNASEYCISYDLQTFYSNYAAICGCKSIVVPEPGVSIEEWLPDEALRYGIAYGEDDLERAISSKQKMMEFIQREQQTAQRKVKRFAEECFEFFGTSGSSHEI